MALRLFEIYFPLFVLFLAMTQVFLPWYFEDRLFPWFRPGGVVFEFLKKYFSKNI